jgi:hypothetical protein
MVVILIPCLYMNKTVTADRSSVNKSSYTEYISATQLKGNNIAVKFTGGNKCKHTSETLVPEITFQTFKS